MERRSSKTRARANKIVDLATYRKNKNKQRRREYERVLFNKVLGVYIFVEKVGLQHVEVIDISFSGVRFREERPDIPLKVGQKIAIRFYFTPSSYLRVVVEVRRVIPFNEADQEGLEYGCELDKQTKSYAALKRLVAFMYRYSEIACRDGNPPLIWF